MERYRILNPAFLGQARPSPGNGQVRLDRAAVQYGDTVIHLLRSMLETDPAIVSTTCWRELMIVHQDQVEALSRTLSGFLATDGGEIWLSSAQYQVFDQVLSCGQEIEEAEESDQGEGFQNVAAMVGILGGLVALVALT